MKTLNSDISPCSQIVNGRLLGFVDYNALTLEGLLQPQKSAVAYGGGTTPGTFARKPLEL
ncbi:hypothetical protein N7537_011053 [Penicillium hordei]|uniref:Uncharacterized protein n=1 Tax=Penicillium hordei TaxID=40994 RepID=A0AAD6GTM4_9EURO|nr:uncharacterized protein N7537_011053 [Penicillium hordei]KAJ5588375.1 hypothetical protein N7537_011053 [Penicillium hordei]